MSWNHLPLNLFYLWGSKMAEPYVPIADLTTYNALLTELEVATDGAETNADALDTAQTSALTSKNMAESALAQKFEILFLVGA
jgi:hypothetical protein